MGAACSAKCRTSNNNDEEEPIIDMQQSANIRTKKKQQIQNQSEQNNECYPSTHFKISEDILSAKGLTCSICLQIVRQAVVDKCGHVYGKRCIQKWLKKSNNCPLSRQEINISDLKQDYNIRRIVEGSMKDEIRQERKEKYLQYLEEQKKIKEKKQINKLETQQTSTQSTSRQRTIDSYRNLNIEQNNNDNNQQQTYIIQISSNNNNNLIQVV